MKTFCSQQSYAAAERNEWVNPINFIIHSIAAACCIVVIFVWCRCSLTVSTNRRTLISMNGSMCMWFWVIYACLIIFPLSLLCHCSLSVEKLPPKRAHLPQTNTRMICNLFCIITIQSKGNTHTHTIPTSIWIIKFNDIFEQNLLNTVNFIAEMQFIVIKSLLKWNISIHMDAVRITDGAHTRSYLHKLNAMLTVRIRLIKEAANIWCLITTLFYHIILPFAQVISLKWLSFIPMKRRKKKSSTK